MFLVVKLHPSCLTSVNDKENSKGRLNLESLGGVAELLRFRQRDDLAKLVAKAKVEYQTFDFVFGQLDQIIDLADAVVFAPIPEFHVLEGLNEEDHRFVLHAILDYCFSRHGQSIAVQGLRFSIDWDASGITNDDKHIQDEDFELPNFKRLPINPQMTDFVEHRLTEARICLTNGAFLAATVMLGSALEAALLGIGLENEQQFHKSQKKPKGRDGKSRNVRDWTLSELIRVSQDLGFLGPAIGKHSEVLMEFRNYIHPSKELKTGFTPDRNTVRIDSVVVVEALNGLMHRD